MDDVFKVVLIAIGVFLLVFVTIVGLLMWRYRIPPRGLVALAMAGFYLMVPVDVVPEAVLGPLGLVDDAGIVSVAVLFALRVARAHQVLRDSGVDFNRRRSAGKPRKPRLPR